jgi:hypothetical protein
LCVIQTHVLPAQLDASIHRCVWIFVIITNAIAWYSCYLTTRYAQWRGGTGSAACYYCAMALHVGACVYFLYYIDSYTKFYIISSYRSMIMTAGCAVSCAQHLVEPDAPPDDAHAD